MKHPITPEEAEDIRAQAARGVSPRAIALAYECNTETVRRVIRRETHLAKPKWPVDATGALKVLEDRLIQVQEGVQATNRELAKAPPPDPLDDVKGEDGKPLLSPERAEAIRQKAKELFGED